MNSFRQIFSARRFDTAWHGFSLFGVVNADNESCSDTSGATTEFLVMVEAAVPEEKVCMPINATELSMLPTAGLPGAPVIAREPTCN